MAGHGKSDYSESYHVIDYVPDVALIADALGLSIFPPTSTCLNAIPRIVPHFSGPQKPFWKRSLDPFLIMKERYRCTSRLTPACSCRWSQFSIMAHSLGGGVAQCFSATFPERVIRLVSIGTQRKSPDQRYLRIPSTGPYNSRRME